MIMVKPASAYLDVISDAKELAKNVSCSIANEDLSC